MDWHGWATVNDVLGVLWWICDGGVLAASFAVVCCCLWRLRWEKRNQLRREWREQLRRKRVLRGLDLDDQIRHERERDAAWFQLWSRVNRR